MFIYREEEGHRLNARECRSGTNQEGLEKGKISIFLYGNKLKGSWALVKMQRTKNDWLLIKHQDEFANPEIDILQQDDFSTLRAHHSGP